MQRDLYAEICQEVFNIINPNMEKPSKNKFIKILLFIAIIIIIIYLLGMSK